MEVIKPVNAKKRFECRDDTKLIARFGLFGLTGFHFKSQTEKILKWISFYKTKAFDCKFDEEMKPAVRSKNEFE